MTSPLRRPGPWLAALAAALLTALPAAGQTVVRWVHLDTEPVTQAYYERQARLFEQRNPGVKVVVLVLENEAFKAKLTTMLQSADKPHIFYSWGGGVMHAQVKAGVLQPLDAELAGAWAQSFSPGALDAFRHQGKTWGVPILMSQVGFYYNKALFAKAGVDAEALKDWPQFLDAVKKLKAAGITPIVAGGGDKWPLHFYWTHLALRLGGKPAFEAAQRGEAGGFAGPVFVKAGERFKELVDLKPFQPGFLGANAPASYGQFGDGRGAMTLMGNWIYLQQRSNAGNKKGLADDEMGWFPFPAVPGGQGDPRETLGGVNGWLLSAGAPPQAVALLKQLTALETQREMAAQGSFIPAVKGADRDMANPFFRRHAQALAAAPYHQLFYDQVLGPSVGRVVNDVTTEIAAGRTTPQAAAEAVERARRQ